MKVVHVIPSLDPASGGPPMVAARLAAAQAMAGCKTEIISYRFPNAQQDIEASLKTVPNFDRVRCEFLDPLTRRERLSASKARRQLALLLAGADVVHLHGVWDPLIYAAASVCQKQRQTYVLTPHGMLDPWALSQKRLKKQIAMFLGYHRMLDRAGFLHFLNADEHALAQPLGLKSRPEIIPNGIFLEEIDPLPPRGRFIASHPEIQNNRFVIFLSRLHYKKGLDYLAGAFAIVCKQLPEIHLVIAGPDGGAQREFENQIRSLGIADRVHIIGPIYGPAKLEALVDAACFCLPSRQEGFSLAVTEAMACQSPVIISKSCHFPEVAEANAGLILELEPAKIAEALLVVLRDPENARRMGQAGRELVISRFTWPIVARRMIDAYEHLVGRPLGR